MISTGGVPLASEGAAGVSVGTLHAAIAAAIAANLTSGAGLPLKLAPTLVTGSGSTDQRSALTVPVGLTVRTGSKYRVNGTLLVRDGATRVAALALLGHVLQRGSDTWTTVKSGALATTLETGWEAYFLSADELPGLDDSNTLSVTTRPLDGVSVTVEADLTIADLGPDT